MAEIEIAPRGQIVNGPVHILDPLNTLFASPERSPRDRKRTFVSALVDGIQDRAPAADDKVQEARVVILVKRDKAA